MATFHIEIPDEVLDEKWPATRDITFRLTRAVLDAVEDGASGHCLRQICATSVQKLPNGYQHDRLGVTVRLGGDSWNWIA